MNAPSPNRGQPRPALFLDRDGTIIRDAGYLADAARVELLLGCVEVLRTFADRGWRLVVITNQSGIARGIVTMAQLRAVNRRMAALLADGGVTLDALYFSPFHPTGALPAYAMSHATRKPRPGLLRLAIEALNIDARRSWMIGDAARDLEAGKAVGCRTCWLRADRGGAALPTVYDAVADAWDDVPSAMATL